MIVTHHNTENNTYSAATALGLIVYGASREYAAKAIAAAIPSFSDYQIEHALSYPSTPSEWRATLASAMASDLEGLREDLESVSDAVANDVSGVVDRVADLALEIIRVKEDAERERYRADLAHRIQVWEADLRSRVPVVLLDAPNLEPGAAYQLILNATPGLTRMKRELEALGG